MGVLGSFGTYKLISKSSSTTSTTEKTIFSSDGGPFILYNVRQADYSTVSWYGVRARILVDEEEVVNSSMPDDGSSYVGVDSGTKPFIFVHEKLEIKIRANYNGYGGAFYANIMQLRSPQ